KLGDVALVEGGAAAQTFEREEAEIDAVAEEQAVDRFGDQERHAEIAQRARGRTIRAHAIIAASDDRVAALHLVNPSRPVGGETGTRLLRLGLHHDRAWQHQVGVDVIAEFPEPGEDHARSPAKNLSAEAIRPSSAEAATVAGEAMKIFAEGS